MVFTMILWDAKGNMLRHVGNMLRHVCHWNGHVKLYNTLTMQALFERIVPDPYSQALRNVKQDLFYFGLILHHV